MCMHVWLMPTAFLRRQRKFSDGSMWASSLQNPRLDSVTVFFFMVTANIFFFWSYLCFLQDQPRFLECSKQTEYWEKIYANAEEWFVGMRKWIERAHKRHSKTKCTFAWTWTWIWPFIRCPRLIWNWIKAFLLLFFLDSEMQWCRAITHNHSRGSDSKFTLSPVNIAE